MHSAAAKTSRKWSGRGTLRRRTHNAIYDPHRLNNAGQSESPLAHRCLTMSWQAAWRCLTSPFTHDLGRRLYTRTIPKIDRWNRAVWPPWNRSSIVASEEMRCRNARNAVTCYEETMRKKNVLAQNRNTYYEETCKIKSTNIPITI